MILSFLNPNTLAPKMSEDENPSSSTWHQFLETTSVHGPAYLVTSRRWYHWQSLLWLLVVVGCAGVLSGIYVNELLVEWKNEPVYPSFREIPVSDLQVYKSISLWLFKPATTIVS